MDSAESKSSQSIEASACGNCHQPLTDGHKCGTADTSEGNRGEKSDDRELSIGSVLSENWKVLSILGEGGMGLVVKAEDLTLGRIVAIKVVHARLLADRGALARFRQEAQASGSLDHPNIIRIHHFGIDDKQRPFLVMDMLDGTALENRLADGGPLPLAEALPILIQTCQALQHAHARGVIHRDLKPSNVMLVNTGAKAPLVKLVDFGIAKVMPKAGVDGMKLTTTGEVLGSPLYMSPEQCLAMELDKRSDIYSMGCLIFAAITGRPPFMNTNVYETYYQHINEMPESVSKYVSGLKNAAEIDSVILKSMAKEPADRYQSMEELKTALEAVGAPKSGAQIGSGLLAPLRLLLLKAKAGKVKIPAWTYPSGGAVALGVASCLAWYLGAFQSSLEQRWNELYVKGQNQMNAGTYADAEKTLNDAVALARSSVPLKKNVGPTLLQLFDLKALENDMPGQQRIEAEYKASLADKINATAELIKNLDAALSKADSQRSTADLEYYAQLCQDSCDMVEACVEEGRIPQGEVASSKAAELALKTLNSPKYKSVGLCLYSVGTIAHRKREYAKAEHVYTESMEFFRKYFSPSEPAISKDLIALGILAVNQKQFDKALEDYTQAQQIRAQAFQSQSEQVAWVKTCRGECYLIMGQKERAIEELRQAKAIYDVVTNSVKPQRARCFALLAWADGKKDEMESALTLQQELLVQTRDYIVFLLDGLAAKAEQDRSLPAFVDASPLYKRGLVIALRDDPIDPSLVHNQLNKLERYYMSKNDIALILPLCLYTASMEEKLSGKDSPQVAVDYSYAAAMARRANDLNACKQYLTRALEIYKKSKSDQAYIEQAKILADMLRLNLDQQQSEEAHKTFELLAKLCSEQHVAVAYADQSVRTYSQALKKLQPDQASKVETEWKTVSAR